MSQRQLTNIFLEFRHSKNEKSLHWVNIFSGHVNQTETWNEWKCFYCEFYFSVAAFKLNTSFVPTTWTSRRSSSCMPMPLKRCTKLISLTSYTVNLSQFSSSIQLFNFFSVRIIGTLCWFIVEHNDTSKKGSEVVSRVVTTELSEGKTFRSKYE